MSARSWEAKVLATPGAGERIAAIEDELRMAAGLTALREDAGLSQRQLAKRIGITQPRVAAIEKSKNVTIEVLEQYVAALGGELEVSVRKGPKRIGLIGPVSKIRTPTKVVAPLSKASKGSSESASGAAPRRARTPS